MNQAAKPWKRERVAETGPDNEEVNKKLLLKNIRALFNKVTPTTKDALTKEFLALKVHQSPSLNDATSIIFDHAVAEPKFCPLFVSMCREQTLAELEQNKNISEFRTAILARGQETFTTNTLDNLIKEEEIEAETDEEKKREKQIEIQEAKNNFRIRKNANIIFIGQLYLHALVSVRIIIFCIVDLLKSVTDKPADLTGYKADDVSVACAVRLLESIGKTLHERNLSMIRTTVKPPQMPFPLDVCFQTLESAISPTLIVSRRTKFMIMNLVALREQGWVPRKATAGPKTLDEIKNDMKSEEVEIAQVRIPIERGEYEWKSGELVILKPRSEYSMTLDREVVHNRNNARYVISEELRDQRLPFDLSKGFENSHIDKETHLKGEPSLQSLCRWAVDQNGSSLKEVFRDAEFVTWRGTLNRIASSLHIKEPWTMVAQTVRRHYPEEGRIILLSEQKKYTGSDMATYAGFKFEQCMTTDVEGNYDTEAAVDNRPTFEMMVRSDVIVDGQSIRLFYGGEIDALRDDEPIEFKTGSAVTMPNKLRHAKTIMQSEFMGVRSIISAIRNENFIVNEVVETSVEELKPSISEHRIGKTARCYAFLHTVLSRVKEFLAEGESEACTITLERIPIYDDCTRRNRQEIVIESISKQEAMDKLGRDTKNGRYIVDNLLERFQR